MQLIKSIEKLYYYLSYLGCNLKKFDINYISEIDAIGARVINKLFSKFANNLDYYWAYLEAYNEIAR